MKSLWIVIIVLAVVVIGIVVYASLNSDMEDSDINNEGDMTSELTYTDVSAMEAYELIQNNPNLIIVDVSPYYDENHLPGAIGYYPNSELVEAVENELDPEATYLVYCHADGPSRAGAQTLIDAGFMNVYRLESHFSGWVEAGYPVEQ